MKVKMVQLAIATTKIEMMMMLENRIVIMTYIGMVIKKWQVCIKESHSPMYGIDFGKIIKDGHGALTDVLIPVIL